jgi:hypothetical protein
MVQAEPLLTHLHLSAWAPERLLPKFKLPKN